ncbi:hypothetical protein [Pseudoalteromonas piratica]|uniref:Solute-binding protein family 3/N-terminal domain-containing protein n=1 Tax=Pseudoalteromonas piratica TaxID=1348114 RepID=A0A0A7EHN2_9GAMM|nr:hypothetical protein [Pseudoalteromonas piratica]AIY66058.1 hypothetical protein OM33_13750 [Pseudoalteromonas piratica]
MLKLCRFKVLVFILFNLLTGFAAYAAKSSNEIDMYIRDDVYVDFQAFVAGRDLHEIKSFTGYRMRRDVVDMVLALQALKIGGFDKRFNYQVGKVTLRNTNILERGKQLLSFDTYWYADAEKIAEYAYISEPVFRKGEYLAGVFAHPENRKVFTIDSLEDFSSFTSISTPRWHADWQTLSSLKLKKLYQDDEWLQQIRAVDKKWADFVLLPFMPALNNHYKLHSLELLAVPGIALTFNDSRHFVVSKKHPDGEAAFNALQKGLRELAKQNRIKKAYIEAGFIPEKGTVKVLNSALIDKQ